MPVLAPAEPIGVAPPPSRSSIPSRPRRAARRTAAPRSPVLPGREPWRRRGARRARARRCRAARRPAQQRGRSQHLPRAHRAADDLDRVQPRRARPHGHAPARAAAQARDRDRGADPAQAPDGDARSAPTSTRSSSTATPRSSSCRARWPSPPATWPASKGCSRTLNRETARTCCSSRAASSPSCRTA